MIPMLLAIGFIVILATAKGAKQVYSPKQFCEKMLPIAEDIERRYGIKKRYTITQAAHESRWGNSQLAAEANNLFGITQGTWKGPIYAILTKEFIGGREIQEVRNFRQYGGWVESTRDWAQLMSTAFVYRYVYGTMQTDNVNKWAFDMQLSGYATDPNYQSKLLGVYNAGKKVCALGGDPDYRTKLLGVYNVVKKYV